MSMTYSSIWRDINWIHFRDTDSRTGIETSWSLWGNVTTIITTTTITKHHHQTCTCSTEMYTWHTSVCPLGPSESLERSIVADLQLPGSRFSDPYGQVKPISKDFLDFFASKTKIWSKDIFNDFCWHSPTYLMNISQNCISSTRFRFFWKDSLLLNYPRWGFMNSERQ